MIKPGFPCRRKDSVSRRFSSSVICRLPVNAPKMINWLTLVSCKQMDLGGSWFLEHVSLKLQFDATLKTIENSLLLMWCWMILVGCFSEGKWKQCNKTQFWLDEMMDVFHSLLIYIVKVNQQITLLWLSRDFPAGGKTACRGGAVIQWFVDFP